MNDEIMSNDNQQEQIDTTGIRESETLQIRVKTMDSNEHQVEVSSSSKVSDLKSKIEEKLKIPISKQRLIFQGKLLKDPQTLSETKIKNSQVVHLVASAIERNERQQQQQQPTENRGNQESANGTTNSTTNNTGFDLVQEIARTINETNFMRRNRRLIFQQNARQYLSSLTFNQRESTETIRQNIIQTRALLDSRTNFDQQKQNLSNNNQSNSNTTNSVQEIQSFDFSQRNFLVGQWVDCKDTIEQWLEAQVIQVNEDKVFIHYNGWGTRWDEWILANSPRLAPFRTYTVQNPRSNYLSPFPNINPDATNFQPPLVSQDLNTITQDILNMMSETQQLLLNFKEQRDMKDKERKDNKEEEKQDSNQQDNVSSLMDIDQINGARFQEEIKEQPSLSNQRTSLNETNIIDEDLQIVYQAAQLAPIVDRMGRMLADFAPHLNQIVKQHHQRLNNLQQNQPQSSNAQSNEQGASSNDTQRPRTLASNLNFLRSPLSSLINLIGRASSQNATSTQERNETNTQQQQQQIENKQQDTSQINQQQQLRIQTQVPIMHSPGEISQVANIFDNRLFEDSNESNIEFHIHAFLSPQPVVPPSSDINMTTQEFVNPNMQNASVGPTSSTQSQLQEQQQQQQRMTTQYTQTPLEQINSQTQTEERDTQAFIQQFKLKNQISSSLQASGSPSPLMESEESTFAQQTIQTTQIENPFRPSNTLNLTQTNNPFIPNVRNSTMNQQTMPPLCGFRDSFSNQESNQFSTRKIEGNKGFMNTTQPSQLNFFYRGNETFQQQNSTQDVFQGSGSAKKKKDPVEQIKPRFGLTQTIQKESDENFASRSERAQTNLQESNGGRIEGPKSSECQQKCESIQSSHQQCEESSEITINNEQRRLQNQENIIIEDQFEFSGKRKQRSKSKERYDQLENPGKRQRRDIESDKEEQ